MNDQDIISEDERHEAASEEPAFLGCPQHMPTHLPSGFDGVEPAKVPLHQGGAGVPPAQKRSCLDKMNETLFDLLGKIREITQDVRHDLIVRNNPPEEDNIKLLGACTQIRQLVDFYKPREKPIDPSAPEVVNPSRLDDIGMRMDLTTVVDDDGVVCKIRRAGVLMMGIGRPAQLFEIDATKHPTYCRVMVYCDHRPIFDGKAFGRNLHRAGILGQTVMIRFIQAQRKHQRNNRKAAVKKLIKEELA